MDVRRVFSRVRDALTRRRHEAEFGEELDSHLAMLTAEYRRQGLTDAAARRAARIRLGNLTELRETHRRQVGLPVIETFAQDLRYAARTLRKAPGFTLIAVLTLTLGMGATTSIFTVIDAVMLRPLPYPDAGALVTWSGGESRLDLEDIRTHTARVFVAGGGVSVASMDFAGESNPLSVRTGYVDGGLFGLFGVAPALGRVIVPADDRPGAARVVVLADRFWRTALGANPAIVGQSISLGGNRYVVIGVMPATFGVPAYDLDCFVPIYPAYPEAAAYRGVHFLVSYWRLRPGVTIASAQAALAVADARLAADHPAEDKGRHTIVQPLDQAVTGDIRPALWTLFGAAAVVLLIACANFAALLMTRAAVRRREMVLRAALGGSAARLVRQVLTESTCLAILGSAAGFVAAWLGVRMFFAGRPQALFRLTHLSMDVRVIGFGLVLAIVTGVVFGWIPAFGATRANVADAMKQEGRTSTTGASGQSMRRLLVAGELALAVVLLAAAGLLMRSFAQLRSVDPGFDPTNVVVVPIQLPATRYADVPTQTLFREAALERLNALPGVSAAMAGYVPLDGGELMHSVGIEHRPPVAVGDEPTVDTFSTMGDYFQVMRMPLRAGRALTLADRADQPLVAVVNEAFVRQFFAGQPAIGQRIHWAREAGPPRWMTIVGIVGDVKEYSLAAPAVPAVFTPFAQSDEAWRRWMSIVVRTDGARVDRATLERAIWSVDPAIPLNRVANLDDLVGVSLSGRTFTLALVGVFAMLAVLLAAVGVYGVMASIVRQRSHEIGVRLAIGATRADVVALISGQAFRLGAAGLVVGLVAAIGVTRLMKTLLFHVAPADPVTLVGVALLMLAVVVGASLVPTWRAVRVDPMVTLRDE